MAKTQKKTGKGRIDKYYKLAKEQGYRARSAFKLIQLNKKYSFLEHSRCCIDLCAAPGGWLQVASKFMPTNSVIIGVDLVPIKPIPRVVTFASDITTTQCRNLIRGEMKDWKADVVLHDGAPNVGTAWIQDAYSQSELVLMSLRLAVEFLARGGTFVTKVFRSADYNNLIWVFNQLFGKVEATKPPSSRNVSAEIFVVCREFLAPKFIDPKFLDPKHVFKDLASTVAEGSQKPGNNVQANVFQPEKKRRKRDGYDDGDYTLFKSVPVSTFVKHPDPISVLGSVSKMTFEDAEERSWLDLDVTSPDIVSNCEDLKVLGKGDFKALLKWRTALREEIGLDGKAQDVEEFTEVAEVAEVDDEQQISEELERLNAEAAARTKRQRRRANEVRTRTIQRMQLQMTAPLDIGLSQQDAALAQGQADVFDLDTAERNLTSRGGLRQLDEDHIMDDDELSTQSEEQEASQAGSDDEDRKVTALEADLDGLYDAYRDRLRERDVKARAREAREKDESRKEWGGVSHDTDSEDSEDGSNYGATQYDSDSESSESGSDDAIPAPKKQRLAADGGTAMAAKPRRLLTKLQPPKSATPASTIWFSQNIFSGVDDLDALDDNEEGQEDETEAVSGPLSAGDDEDEEPDDVEIVPHSGDSEDGDDTWDPEGADSDEEQQALVKSHSLTSAEAVTLAQQLVNRQKTKTQMINDGFNRYSLNAADGLPTWFIDDESKHYQPNLPVTKEAIAALRAKQRALDARPIKKVAEAKARKKYKAIQRLEKAMKKAEGVNSTADMSEKEKAQQIEKLMRKGASSKKPKKEIKLVVAKGSHKGIKGRPKGVKGRYTMVDSRMKKELRAKKRVEKAGKKRKRS